MVIIPGSHRHPARADDRLWRGPSLDLSCAFIRRRDVDPKWMLDHLRSGYSHTRGPPITRRSCSASCRRGDPESWVELMQPVLEDVVLPPAWTFTMPTAATQMAAWTLETSTQDAQELLREVIRCHHCCHRSRTLGDNMTHG